LKTLRLFIAAVGHYQRGIRFPLIPCRAFAALNTILDLTQHLVTSGSRVLAMKGREEMPALAAGYTQLAQHTLHVPWLNEERRLIEIKQTE